MKLLNVFCNCLEVPSPPSGGTRECDLMLDA